MSPGQKATVRAHRSRGQAALRKLVGATAITSFGDGLLLVALPLLAIRLTSNALLIGGLVTALGIPWLVVGLPAGALADRVNRRRLVVIVDVLRALIVGMVALTVVMHEARIGELYAAAFLLGAGETMTSAAARSIVPRAVSGDAIVVAQGRMQAARTGAVQFAGPSAGGALFAAVRALPFAGDALSFLASAGLLRSALADVEVTPSFAGRDLRPPLMQELHAGLRWFSRSRLMITLAGTVGAFAFCQAMVLGVLVVYGSRVLHLGAFGYGIFLALAAVGDLVGSLLAARVHANLRPYLTILLAGVVAAGGYVLLGSTSHRAVAVVALALEAAATSIGNVAVTSARYREIPRERFGAMNNLFRSLVYGLGATGALVGGALAAAHGTQGTFVVAGVLQLATLALLAAPLRRLRAGEPQAAQPQAA